MYMRIYFEIYLFYNNYMYASQKNKYSVQRKAKQCSHVGKHVKLLNSFDAGHLIKKRKSKTEESRDLEQINRKINLLSRHFRKISNSKTTNMVCHQEDLKHRKFNQISEQYTMDSRSSGKQCHNKYSEIYLPQIHTNLDRIGQRHSISHKRANLRINTQPSKPSKRFPKIVFNKLQGARSGNLLQYYRMKPTEQYFTKLQNVIMAEKLLLVEPSKNLRKSQHKKFWEQQKTYRSSISRSVLMKKTTQVKLKSKCSRQSKFSWIN